MEDAITEMSHAIRLSVRGVPAGTADTVGPTVDCAAAWRTVTVTIEVEE